MIRSMTGFGRTAYTENDISVTAEVYSVNGRFFDVKVKIPKSLYNYEGELRKIAQSYIERGRVTISVSFVQPSTGAEKMVVDFDLAGRYIQLAQEMSSQYKIDNTIDVRTLLLLPEIICWNENDSDIESLWEIAKKAVVVALKNHRDMKDKEGLTIEKDMRERLASITGYVEEIGKRAPEAVEANTLRLRKKIESLLPKDAFDETRFSMEVALYADRIDITEECVRLKSHIEQFSHEIEKDRTSGRKLSFLLQEMNRESNTIGSKVMDASISQTVVSIKEELEKIREHTENIE